MTVEALIHPQGDGVGGGLPIDRPPDAAEPGRAASNDALHRSRAADEAGARSGDRAGAELTGRIASSKPPISIASTSTGPRTRSWSGRGGTESRIVGLMAKNLPTTISRPSCRLLMAPRLIELCFQTAGLWEMGVQGRMGLPQHIDRVSLLLRRRSLAEGSLYAVVTPDQARGKLRCGGDGSDRKPLRAT